MVKRFFSSTQISPIIEQQRFQESIADLYIYDIADIRNLASINQSMRTNFFCMFLLNKGELHVNLNLKPFKITSNKLCVIIPSTVAETTFISNDCELLGLVFTPEFLTKTGVIFNHQETLEMFVPNAEKVLTIQSDEAEILRLLLQRLKQLNASNSTHLFSREIIYHTFLTLFYEVSNVYRKNKTLQKPKITRKEHLVIQFIQALQLHFRNERSVRFYADILFITRKHLTKIVKEITGKTPCEIIDEAVIFEAKLLLSNPALNINEVAQNLQFTDQSVFGKYFKKHFGTSPTAFRNTEKKSVF
ncbi:helix-turn-helix domain-containing protein [Olivibacter domesticus]|uniref:AraC-type DNA-binding protein n=1 Tax=Olivibacter domesticus TaxID=407022 RepID=A0A1H7TKV0_OLID1|nr:AraC family transcriptional regulator [Olivibacter domesticus]SEL85532.1 AraC-type DNA-binding protein [Olivibacter domesticus]